MFTERVNPVEIEYAKETQAEEKEAKEKWNQDYSEHMNGKGEEEVKITPKKSESITEKFKTTNLSAAFMPDMDALCNLFTDNLWYVKYWTTKDKELTPTEKAQ